MARQDRAEAIGVLANDLVFVPLTGFGIGPARKTRRFIERQEITRDCRVLDGIGVASEPNGRASERNVVVLERIGRLLRRPRR
jgi:hypothetical protein